MALSTVTIQTFPARARILRFDSWYCLATSDQLLPFRPPLSPLDAAAEMLGLFVGYGFAGKQFINGVREIRLLLFLI